MNEEQIRLVKLSNAQMPIEELNRISRMVAHTKRAMELVTLIPGASDELRNDAEAFVSKYNLIVDDLEGLKKTVLPEYADYRSQLSKAKETVKTAEEVESILREMPEIFFRYGQFFANKIHLRDRLRDTVCVPSNERVRVWRERQVNRCQGSVGGANGSFVHAVITYELAEGCSVGCEFCGLSAGRLKQLFRYTDENAELFRGVLKVCHEVLGDAAGQGMMYFATEPLDNPDYEMFEDDYYKEFHVIPQITTAVADRNVDRTKQLVSELYRKPGGFVHRFTLRSLEMAHKIFESFTPEELILVELLPQYEEAPGFVSYTIVGKQADVQTERADGLEDPGTICCVDGFRVNFARRELSVFTPCHMTEDAPNGIAIAETVSFTDADDFRDKLNYLIDTYMVVEIPRNEPLALYDYYVKDKDPKYGNVIRSKFGGELLLLDKFSDDYMYDIVDYLIEGKYNKYEIAEKIRADHEMPTERTFYFLNQLWKKGFILDRKFFRK